VTDREAPGATGTDDWPTELHGVTESIVATRGPNDRWNYAALGLFAPARTPGSDAAASVDAVTARTWGRTRTRRNFDRTGGGVVQFTTDPVEFVDAALTVFEGEDQTLPGAAAWAEVDATELATGEDGGTVWTDWRLDPVESTVEREIVPTINRGFNAVIEATVVVSRLEVPGYDEQELRDRLDYLASVVETAGRDSDQAGLSRIEEVTDWNRDSE
jgi:hypothetical protein